MLYLGSTQFEGLDLFFGFDGERLELVSRPGEESRLCELCSSHFGPFDGPFLGHGVPINSDYLELYPTNEDVKLIAFPRGNHFDPSLSAPTRLGIDVGAYYVLTRKASVSGIRFRSRHLSNCFDTRKALVREVSVDFKSFSVSTTDTNPVVCDFDHKGHRVTATIFHGSTLSFRAGEPPLNVESLLDFDFDDEGYDYPLLLELICIARRFLRFCLQVSDAEFDSIQLLEKREEVGEGAKTPKIMSRCGDAIVCHKYWQSDFSPRFIVPLGKVEGFEGAVLEKLASVENGPTLRHLPRADRVRHWDEARSILLAAAFDFEFSKLYPAGIRQNEREANARAAVLNALNNLLEEGSQDRRLRRLVERVETYVTKSDAFSSKLIRLYKDHKDVICHLSPSSSTQEGYYAFAERVNRRRNALAHGYPDSGRDARLLDDSLLLEKVVISTQLLNFGLCDEDARELMLAAYR